MNFNYISAEYTESRITRIYKSECGNIGKVKRTPVFAAGSYGKQYVRYFLWNKPDSHPEYESLDECLKALTM